MFHSYIMENYRMAKITHADYKHADYKMVELKPKMKRFDAIESFVSQQTR